MKKKIDTPKAPIAIGPYSQGIYVDGWLFVSGQIPIDPVSGKVIDDNPKQQTKQVMENVHEILKKAGLNWSDIVKTTIYLTSMNDFKEVNEVYESYLTPPYPARATVEVSRLPKSVDVEIEVIAKS